MATEVRGKLDGSGLRVAVIVSRFNEFITSHLLEGARHELIRHGVAEQNLTIIWVPGSWELPLAAKTAVGTGRFDAVVCLGAVIRGHTSHHEHVAAAAARGIADLALACGVPVAFGVLTCDSLEQAIERSGAKSGNKGADAAISAIEMVSVLAQIGGSTRRK